ncbi:MAG: serine/threonine protein kinase [Deltaproteobacteria bacterium]|nr:serine/threonine protein kinase [Deltaproteobacteria bacterium]
MQSSFHLRGEAPLLGQWVFGCIGVIGLLGKGGMGAVYAGEQCLGELRLAWALKTFSPSRALSPAGIEQLRQRFRHEGQLHARLEHERIVRCKGLTTDPATGIELLLLERAAGCRLSESFARRELTLGQLVEVTCQLLDALAYLQKNKVVHRDVKPGNVMVDVVTAGAVSAKLIDFGIARQLDEQAIRLTTEGEMAPGTWSYMAPELRLGQAASYSSDVWALGMVLAEGLVGRPLAVVEATRRCPGPVGQAVERPPGLACLHPELAHTLERMLDARPERRPAASELLVSFRKLGLGRLRDLRLPELQSRLVRSGQLPVLRRPVAAALAAIMLVFGLVVGWAVAVGRGRVAEPARYSIPPMQPSVETRAVAFAGTGARRVTERPAGSSAEVTTDTAASSSAIFLPSAASVIGEPAASTVRFEAAPSGFRLALPGPLTRSVPGHGRATAPPSRLAQACPPGAARMVYELDGTLSTEDPCIPH